MVSPFTLGLFAPLPLAMMIPFMATQSLAMGEAFGKSFQYGKRKISSMTNEEFNKLTFSDLMDQQTANIKQIIPALATQMADSNIMQEKVFQEMTKLIPAFIKGLNAGAKDIIKDDNLTIQNLAPAPLGLAEALVPDSNVQKAIIEAFNAIRNASVAQMIGYQQIAKQKVTSTPATQGPVQESPPTNTFNNIQDIQKQITAGTIQTPESFQAQHRILPTPPTADQLRRQAITESGLSPLAYASREKFKANIIEAQRVVTYYQTDLTAYEKARDSTIKTTNWKTLVARIPAQKALVAKAVAKLSSLRIKYKSVYGVYI